MPLTSKYFSDNSCTRECKGSIERTSDDVLTIRDESAGGYFYITTEIDLSGRTIRKTWKVFAFTWHKVYTLDDDMAAETRDQSRLMEGYPLPLFAVLLSGKGRKIKIYSTDDFEEAKAVQREITGLLMKTDVSTAAQ